MMDTNFVRVLQLHLHPHVCTTCLCLHRVGGEALCCSQKLSFKGMWGPQWSRELLSYKAWGYHRKNLVILSGLGFAKL